MPVWRDGVLLELTECPRVALLGTQEWTIKNPSNARRPSPEILAKLLSTPIWEKANLSRLGNASTPAL